MPFVAKANVVTAILHWTFHGTPGVNVIDCRVAAGYSVNGSLVNTLNTAIIGTFTSSSLNGVLASTTTYTGVGLRDMRTEGQAEVLSTNGTFPFVGVGLALPNQVAAVLTKRTALAGRFFRGRLYVGGFVDTANSATGRIDDAIVPIITSWGSALGAALTTNSLTPAVHSPAYPSRPSSIPGAPDLPPHPETLTDITAWILRDQVWDTQRRRLT
jgi:hypothetical protein